MSSMEHEVELLKLIGEVLLEKRDSLRSKVADNTQVQADTFNLAFAEEVIALAKNRLSVLRNEQRKGEDIWLERSDEQYPHIRLHGGVREDDLPQ
jgi:hypothetical protein